MRMSVNRRLVAAVATAGLVVVALPMTATSASAVDACAAGATCDVSLNGSLGVSPGKIMMPANFNGTVLLYSHGYRIGTPVPAALAAPLGLTTDPNSVRLSVPSFAAAFGSDVAFMGGNGAEVAPNTTVATNLLSQGYALAGAGYAKQGWASAEGVQAGETMLAHIEAGAIPGVKKVLVWGSSLGGLISQTIAERNPSKIAGSLPACGVLMGPEQAFNTAMSVMFTWKTLIAPTLRVANYQSYPQALGDLATVLGTLSAVSTTPISAAKFPTAQANLLAGLLGGLPSKSAVYDGITVNPIIATLAANPAIGPAAAPSAASAQGYSPVTAGASSVVAMLQNVGGAAALGILGRYELEQRARAIASIPATESANFNDNVQVSYTNLLSPEQAGEFGDTLNASTALAGGVLKVMLGTLDASKGNATVRFPANAAAVAAVKSLPAPTGKYSVPTVFLSTTFDSIVPAGNSFEFHALLAASAKKQGKLLRSSQFYTSPPEDGWTSFQPGAKAPDTALSVAKLNGSGVGHCVFSTDNQVQWINAVAALNSMSNAKTARDIKKINHTMWLTPGVNGDGFFEPDPLKHPALAR